MAKKKVLLLGLNFGSRILLTKFLVEARHLTQNDVPL